MAQPPPHKRVAALNAKKRREAVEEAIRERGWSESVVGDLVAQTGASRRTLYRDRDEVAELLAQEETAGLEQRRALFLNDLRRVRDEARVGGQYNPAARLLDMEARVLGLDRVPLPEVDEPADEVLDTSLEGVLREVRKLRRQAQAGHSYVAADKLLAREQELVEGIRKRDEATRAAELAHLDETAIVELIIENAASLPEGLRARLREALG
jgi:hypothetical protein